MRSVVFHRIVFVAFAAMLLCVTAISGSAIANNVASLSSFGLAWTPQALESVSNGSRSVSLTTTLPNNASAAIVDISLEAEEAEALKSGMGERLPIVYESDLCVGDDAGVSSDNVSSESSGGGVSSSVEYAADSSNLLLIMPGTNPNVAEDSGEEELEDSGSIAAEEDTLPSERTDGASDGAVLRLLTEGNSDSATTGSSFDLTFSIPNGSSGTDGSSPSAEPARDLKIEVGSSDVFYKTYGGDATSAAALGASDIPGILDVSLLNDSNATQYIGGLTPFTVYETAPQALIVTASPDDYEFGVSKEFFFGIEILKQSNADDAGSDGVSIESDAYNFALTLPEQLGLPEGEYKVEKSTDSATIKCGDMAVATVSGLPTGATVSDDVNRSSAQSLTFSVSIPKETDPVIDASYHELSLSVNGASLTRTPDDFTGAEVSLSAAPSEGGGSEVKATATVSASKAEGPNDGGWGIDATEPTNLDQNVFWNDNNSASRPQWGWGEGKLHPRLYFTINGVEYELTEATMEIVGLEAMPELSQSSVSTTLTVSGLPTKIRQTSADQNGKEFNVSWRIAPPSTVPNGYTFLNLTAADVGEDHNYSSVDTPGWYFMLQDTFEFRLNVSQGDYGNLSENVVKEMMRFFNFKWAYGEGKEGSDNILAMINAHDVEATFDADNRVVTIEGLWAYNVDGSPITYKVVEAGTSPDQEITQKELLDSISGFPMDVLEENDSYAVQYDNAGVPNYGDKTDAVYNGGTLRLVRHGDTSYTATKIWLDSYEQSNSENRPHPTFKLYRYREDQLPTTAIVMSDYTVSAQWIEDSDSGEFGRWEIVVKDASDNAATLEKYDPMNGYEWIYVVKETLNDSSYQQVFGKVAVSDDEGVSRGEVIPGTDVGPDADDESWKRAEGDVFLYNEGTLTNQLKDSVPVLATKTWNASSFQNTFNQSAVELKLQYRKAGSGDNWQDYTYQDENSETKTIVRYLHNFSSMFLTNSLIDVPSVPKHLVTEGGTTQEVEYRWLEVAVYETAPNATETSLGDNATGKYKVEYDDSHDGKGRFEVDGESRIYLVKTEVDNNATTITNTLQDTLNYEVVKKWQDEKSPEEITISLYQAVTGTDFEYTKPYLTFTMSPNGNGGYTVSKDNEPAWPDNVDLESSIYGWANPDDEGAYWPAVVTNLPKYNNQGQAYEYLLLENGRTPQYKTVILGSGDYRTTVINGVGEDGFSFMVRKIWLDDSDVQHRKPVTFTVYNRHTGNPIQIYDSNGTTGDYTFTIGGDGVWHEVFWTSTSNWTADSKTDVGGAGDIYVVETKVGDSTVNNCVPPTFDSLYNTNNTADIFDVTTENHRYQVTYEYSSNDDNSGVPGTFTVTNRRLGNVDITVSKMWVDGRLALGDSPASSETLSQTLANVVKEIKNAGGENLALVFQLEFQDKQDGWYIQNTGHLSESDAVCVGGEEAPIYESYAQGTTDPSGDAWKEYGEKGSSQQIIVGLDNNGDTVVRDNAYFFGLPKYDSEGNPVKYKVSEKWVKLINDGNGETTTKPVDLAELITDEENDNLKQLYTQLNNLWSNYQTDITESYEENHDNAAHVRDFQTIKITNRRTDVKPVTWTKEWKDNFTSNTGLRPDIYLDVYAVVHKPNTEGTGYIRQIRKITSTGDWAADFSDGTQSITLLLPQFDSYGIEIAYYAVERTAMSAGDYDYAAGKYSLDETDLGTRDNPSNTAKVLSEATSSGNETTQFTVLDLNATGADAIGWETPGDKPNDFGEFGTASGDYPRYALMEGGTFTNVLENTHSINGMKYWYNLPANWNDARLPTVKFSVYNSTNSTVDTNGVAVATLEVPSDLWPQIRQGNRYTYLIEYTGENTLSVENGIIACVGGPGATELPRYDESGNLLYYAVKEEVNFGGDNGVDPNNVFQMVGNGFTFTNTYKPETGTIKVKKFLYLPMKTGNGVQDPEAYPAVTFELTRQVENAEGTSYENDTAFTKLTQTIGSSEVEAAWSQLDNDGKSGGYVTLTTAFDNLPLYAPDGSKYRYTVTEVKTSLNGYDTYVVSGDKDSPDDVTTSGIIANGLVPTRVSDFGSDSSSIAPAATFKNKQPAPVETYGSFIAVKVWEDFDGSTRPTTDAFESLLTLKRTAAAQPVEGGENGKEEMLVLDEDYEIGIVESSTNSNEWRIEIKPKSGTSFEKYYANGMPWKYELSEPLTESGRLELDSTNGDSDENKIYTPLGAESNGVWPTVITNTTDPTVEDGTAYSFGELTNSVKTKALYSKAWVDSEGSNIESDYLGFDLTVTFQLQVRTQTSADGAWSEWQNAFQVEAVKDAMGTDWQDTAELTGRVAGAGSSWSGSFEGLPGVAKDNDGVYTYYEYRVVETSVKNGSGSTSQGISIDTDGAYAVEPEGLVTSATFSKSNNTSVSTNELGTTSVSVTKVWEDGSNQYGTRPGASGPWTWSAWFVLQRTTDDPDNENATWVNVAVFDKLFGQDQNSANESPGNGMWAATIAGLPTTDYSGASPEDYTYRVRELQPPASGDGYTLEYVTVTPTVIVDEGDLFNSEGSAYATEYAVFDDKSVWTVTNALDLYTPDPDPSPTSLKAVKDWVGQDKNGSVSSVTFQLQYREDGSNREWQAVPFGSAEKTANEDKDWAVSWDDLPSTYNGEEVEYRIVEKAADGWVQLAEPVGASGSDVYTYTFKNSVVRNYEVEKVWNSDAATPSEGASVTVALFRTANKDEVGSIYGQPVPVSETQTSSSQRMAQLTSSNDWSVTFEGLPKYNEEGKEYYYYALEMSDGEPVSQPGTVEVGGKDYSVTYDFDKPQSGFFAGLLDLFTGNDSYEKTTITNTSTTELQGTKEWLDNSNAYGTRPGNITLALWRTTAINPTEDDWKQVTDPVDLEAEGIVLTWDKDLDSNEWTFTYANLPAVDDNGASYTYRVTEVEPAGYDAMYVHAEHKITNTLAGTVTINGTKAWVGGKADDAPELTLECRLAGSTSESDWQEVDNATVTWNEDLTTFTFSNLSKYDANGALYEYRVRETVPDDYEAGYAMGTAANGSGTIGNTSTRVDGASITNYKDGELSVTKTVSGNRSDTARKFAFTLTLSGSSSAGTSADSLAGKSFSYVVTNESGDQVGSGGALTFAALAEDPDDPDASGNAVVSDQFNLSHGQTLTVSGLPAGISYKVIEVDANKDGYSTSSTNAAGTVPAGGASEVKFHNSNHVTPSVDVPGTKTWADDSDAAGLRPDSIELVLYRSVAGGEEQVVEGVEPVWTKNGDTWSYVFRNVPEQDAYGRTYTYRVQEATPDGYTATYDGNNITNTLGERVDVSGAKTWTGDDEASRPESITVTLYANGEPIDTVTVTAADGWAYSFGSLPRYDADGNEIAYTVVETPVPEGYEAVYNGFDVTNSSVETVGSLRVAKQVVGSEGETDREFSFTVTLGDSSINGVYGDMTFVNGVASITLRHGQSVVATGLPAGVHYDVNEAAVDGYEISATGQTGSIVADAEVVAAFTNSKGSVPDAPSNPETPGEPSGPNEPDHPSGSDGSGTSSSPFTSLLPSTGDRLTMVMALLALSAVSLGGFAAYAGKKRSPYRGKHACRPTGKK